jgi:hypothetical protein
MAILNEDVEFLDLTPEQQGSFRGGAAHVRKQLLPPGTQLRKRVSDGGGFNRESAYWTLEEDWKLHIEQRRAPGVTKDAAAKARLAVSDDFQPNLNRQLYARLLQAVWAFRGPAKWQPLQQSDPKAVLIGGAPQVVIPNLTSKQIVVLHAVK